MIVWLNEEDSTMILAIVEAPTVLGLTAKGSSRPMQG